MAIITVTNTRDSGAGSLREAIARAQAGDTVKFAATLANKTITLTSGYLEINKALTIDGAGAANLTVSGNNARQVFYVPKFGTVAFKNLTIANGKTTGSGGAIQLRDYGTLTVVNCRFNNNAAGIGGAISVGYGSKATVLNSQFDGNDGTLTNSTYSAGAIATGGSSVLTVRGSQFTNNRGVNGGAIYSLLGALTIEDSTFLKNSSAGALGGGAVFADGANPIGPGSTVGGTIAIRRSRVEGNQTKGEGGGLFLYGYGQDKIIVEDSAIVGNAVTSNGKYARGGGLRTNSNLTLRNVTVANNTATKQGGGLWIDGGYPVNILNSTFSGNQVADDAGGAMFLNTTKETPISIKNSTIVNNTAGRASGAMWLNSSTQAVTLTNSIVANNTAGDRYQQQIGYAPRDGGGNIEFPAPGYGNLRVTASSRIVDPRLGSLQTINGVLIHPLLTGSPAINTGVSGAPTIDERGFLRDSKPDVGAFEFGSTTRPALPLQLWIDDTTGLEGNSGTSDRVFTVSLSAVSKTSVTVNYATADGNAKAGADYVARSGKLTFKPGETSKTIRVPVIGDAIPELSEVFYVNLSGATGASLGDGQGVGIIPTDDGLPPSIAIDDVSLTEPRSGTSNAVFTVKLSGAGKGKITVSYATADSTAIAGQDYKSTKGTLTFNPGETTKTIAVPVLSGTLTEADETFFVNLSNPNDARFGDGKGVATLKNAATAPLTASAASTTLAQSNDAGGSWFTSDLATASSRDLSGVKSTSLTAPLMPSTAQPSSQKLL
ncbi:MAG: right-handed parallel beta-helix repeat-containing protein [Lyngbya sp. HA4199-MV5]|jgi:hypothetical protein|nr:right-handed parallel beta-helix repeat-containing protein [Lyngbya sp. HA4199-MV5]